MMPIDLRLERRRFEHGHVKAALDFTGNNKNRAAKLLGLQRSTLIMMMKRLELEHYVNEPRQARREF